VPASSYPEVLDHKIHLPSGDRGAPRYEEESSAGRRVFLDALGCLGSHSRARNTAGESAGQDRYYYSIIQNSHLLFDFVGAFDFVGVLDFVSYLYDSPF
jgi:hypothetical protein